MVEYLYGLPVYTNPNLVDLKQVRFPKTKKKRIKKKFAKDKRNYKSIPSKSVVATPYSLIVHPLTLMEIKKSLNEYSNKPNYPSDLNNNRFF